MSKIQYAKTKKDIVEESTISFFYNKEVEPRRPYLALNWNKIS